MNLTQEKTFIMDNSLFFTFRPSSLFKILFHTLPTLPLGNNIAPCRDLTSGKKFPKAVSYNLTNNENKINFQVATATFSHFNSQKDFQNLQLMFDSGSQSIYVC